MRQNPDDDAHDEGGQIDRPVRRYALILGILFLLFTIAVFAHFLLVEQPQHSPEEAEQAESIED